MCRVNPRTLGPTLLGGLLMMFATGCGGSGDLKGKVSFKGATVKGGFLTFVPEGGGQSYSCSIEESGSYEIKNMKSGTYKVCVDTESLKPGGNSQSSAPGGSPMQRSGGGPRMNTPPKPAMPDENDKSVKSAENHVLPETGYTPGSPPAAMKKAQAERYVAIPGEYAKPESTKLTYTFPGGSQTYNVELN